MKHIYLNTVSHNVKIGDTCPTLTPNITESCIFYENNKPIGFYLDSMPDKLCKLSDIANNEFISNRVTKQGRGGSHYHILDNNGNLTNIKHKQSSQVKDTAIIGRVPPQSRFGRKYFKMSNIHEDNKSEVFIKAMLLLLNESESIVRDILPEQFDIQSKIYNGFKYKLSKLFTSSICNNNISAPYHIDSKNEPNTVNIIICKKYNVTGGHLHIPDYNAVIEQRHNSLLVYPVWKNIHGVTPIIKKYNNGYRNSLVFYPLKNNLEGVTAI